MFSNDILFPPDSCDRQAFFLLHPLYQAILGEPRHHCSEARSDGFDRVIFTLAFEPSKLFFPRIAFGHPFICKLTALDLTEDSFHLGPRIVRDNSPAAR